MYKFVCVVIVASFALVALAAPGGKLDELRNKFLPSASKCASSSGLTQKEAEDFFVGNKTVTNKMGCFISCMAKEYGLVNDKNLFDKDKIFKLVDALQAEDVFKNEDVAKEKEILAGCLAAQTAGAEACAVGKSVAECTIAAMEKAGIKSRK